MVGVIQLFGQVIARARYLALFQIETGALIMYNLRGRRSDAR